MTTATAGGNCSAAKVDGERCGNGAKDDGRCKKHPRDKFDDYRSPLSTVIPTNDSESEPAPVFDVVGVHKMKPHQVFGGGATPRFLLFVAFLPVLSFMVGVILFLTVSYPFFLLQVSLVTMIPLPIICWFLAVAWHTTTVYVWRLAAGTDGKLKAVLSQEPWKVSDTWSLPASARHTAGQSRGFVPVIDTMPTLVDEGNVPVRESTGTSFDPRGGPVSVVSDATVSSFLQTQAGTTIYSARPEKDKFRNIKMGFMFAMLAFVPFITWLVISSLTEVKPPPA